MRANSNSFTFLFLKQNRSISWLNKRRSSRDRLQFAYARLSNRNAEPRGADYEGMLENGARRAADFLADCNTTEHQSYDLVSVSPAAPGCARTITQINVRTNFSLDCDLYLAIIAQLTA